MADAFTNLVYHLVFSTKHREPSIIESLRDRLYAYMGGIVRQQRGKLFEIGGMPDHVHLLVRLRADASVSETLRTIKANSSRWMNETLPQPKGFRWQAGYGAFSVSESQIPGVRRYIRGQAEHHAKTSFKEELMALLKKNRIEYDERYLFD
jgi:REP element-mobilizing transposase RayT